MTNDIFVQMIDLKTTKVKETITCNDDGSYTIFLNTRFNNEQLLNAYIHALNHILRLDFECRISSVDEIESNTHELDSMLTTI